MPAGTLLHSSLCAHLQQTPSDDALPPLERRRALVQQRVHPLLQLQLPRQVPHAPLQPRDLPRQRETLARLNAAQTPMVSAQG